MARPVKWTEKRIGKLVNKLRAYCHEASERSVEVIQTKKGIEIIGPKMPSLIEALKKSRFNSKYIYKLGEIWPRLNDAIEKIKDLQSYCIQTMTLQGAYKAQGFAIVAMANNHGWNDGVRTPLVDQSQHTHLTITDLARKLSEKKTNDRFGNDGAPSGESRIILPRSTGRDTLVKTDSDHGISPGQSSDISPVG